MVINRNYYVEEIKHLYKQKIYGIDSQKALS